MATVAEQIQGIYIGLLGRAADKAGADYWTQQVSAKKLTIEQVRANIVNEQTEYKTGLGALNRPTALKELYQRLFNRDPEANGLDYWASGGGKSVPFDQLVLALINGASQNDNQVLDNRTKAAEYYTNHTKKYSPDSAKVAVTSVDGSASSLSRSKAATDNNTHGSDNNPDNGTTNPDNGTNKPDNGTTNPDNGTNKPDNGTTNPDNGTTNPDNGTTNPDNGTTNPDNGTNKPDNGTTNPNNGTTNPDNGTTNPDNGTNKPDNGTTNPDNGTPPPDSTGPKYDKTYNLSSGIDKIVGSTGNDLIDSKVLLTPAGQFLSVTLGAFDSIDGGAGTDTLSITQSVARTYALPSARIENIENLIINNNSGKVTANAQSISGLQSVTVNNSNNSEVDITTKSNVTSVSVTKGGNAISLVDAGSTDTTADTLHTVSLTGNTTAANISSDTLTTLTLKDSTAGATVTAATGTRELMINLENVTSGSVIDTNATSAVIATATRSSSGVTIDTDSATQVTINAAADLSAGLEVDAAQSIDINGASKVVITGGNFTALQTLDASDNSGGIELSLAGLNQAVTINGSTGNDVIIGTAANDTITGSAGSDRLNGGSGNDIFVFKALDGSDSTASQMDRIENFTANTAGNTAGTEANSDSTNWNGDVLKFNVADATITQVDVSVVNNAVEAQAFLTQTGSSTSNTLAAAFDKTTHKLFVDLNSDGSTDSVIELAGVTTLAEAAIVLA